MFVYFFKYKRLRSTTPARSQPQICMRSQNGRNGISPNARNIADITVTDGMVEYFCGGTRVHNTMNTMYILTQSFFYRYFQIMG